MPDHFHALIYPMEEVSIQKILQDLNILSNDSEKLEKE
jgi:hypothetical protein